MATEPFLARIARYRNRATELRATAEIWTDPEARESLVRVAISYEQLAEMIERTGERMDRTA
jgi:DNA-binding TFAR19-related protein (PDSD5 family)